MNIKRRGNESVRKHKRVRWLMRTGKRKDQRTKRGEGREKENYFQQLERRWEKRKVIGCPAGKTDGKNLNKSKTKLLAKGWC